MPQNRSDAPGCLFAILKLFGLGGASQVGRLPSRTRDDFLSPAEFSFFHVLCQAVGDRAYVCAKIRVADILFVVDRRQNMGDANRIAQKHVDFLLCDPATMKPLAAVELDDSSHRRDDRAERDAFLDRAFEAAALPLLHVKAKRAYSVDEVAELVSSHLNTPITTKPEQTTPQDAGDGPPTCPSAMSR